MPGSTLNWYQVSTFLSPSLHSPQNYYNFVWCPLNKSMVSVSQMQKWDLTIETIATFVLWGQMCEREWGSVTFSSTFLVSCSEGHPQPSCLCSPGFHKCHQISPFSLLSTQWVLFCVTFRCCPQASQLKGTNSFSLLTPMLLSVLYMIARSVI